MAIEINTSGLDRHPVVEMYPAADLLRRARAAGIALTFGSDAHHAADVGSHFSEAVQLARSAGYFSWLRLSDRKAVALRQGTIGAGAAPASFEKGQQKRYLPASDRIP
jgi:histidinol-phosphatase (PHP family)